LIEKMSSISVERTTKCGGLKEVFTLISYQILVWICNTYSISEITAHNKTAMNLLSPVIPVSWQPRQVEARWAVSHQQPLEGLHLVWQ